VSDSAVSEALPLSALLSQTLVAFTIEFDNEAERQLEHRTTSYGGTRGGVWLVSMAMWLNCMRYVSQDPITVGQMHRIARARTNLDGMRRWGYITVTPDPADGRSKPREADLLVRATPRGLRAQQAWGPLTGVIEQRWRERYGADVMDRLADSLQAIARHLGDWLPDCLPILGYGLFSAGTRPGENRYDATRASSERQEIAGAGAGADGALPLPWLLARVLLAFAIDFELEAKISLAIAANALRLIDEKGTRIKDMPALSGVSPEGLAMATGYLEKHGLAEIGTAPAGERWKVARLTPAGRRAAAASRELLSAVEYRWSVRYGAVAVGDLRQALKPLVGDPAAAERSPLFAAIEPYPDGWRASVRRPVTLPYYPMVLHRGGYPDGS
jgi:DNA-binding MarR family transcriptional regulator